MVQVDSCRSLDQEDRELDYEFIPIIFMLLSLARLNSINQSLELTFLKWRFWGY